MPVIVAPKESIDSVNENFFPNVITSKIVRKPDNEKFSLMFITMKQINHQLKQK